MKNRRSVQCAHSVAQALKVGTGFPLGLFTWWLQDAEAPIQECNEACGPKHKPEGNFSDCLVFIRIILLQTPCRNSMGKPEAKGEQCYLQTVLTKNSKYGTPDNTQHLKWQSPEQILGMWIIYISLLNFLGKAIVLSCTSLDCCNWHLWAQ